MSAGREPDEQVLGLGIDLVETDRLRRALDAWGARLKRRLFREAERAYCESRACPWRHYAGRFAVKEAVGKAFGTGIGGRIGWLDMEVRRDARSGAPVVEFFGAGRRLARSRGVRRALVSLSHGRHAAVAQALLLGRATGRRKP